VCGVPLTFSGFTDNPYQKWAWIHTSDDLGMLVFILDGFCVPAIGYFLYQCGRLSGTLEGRRLQLDLEARRRYNEEAEASSGSDSRSGPGHCGTRSRHPARTWPAADKSDAR
jgi:hypothetical protein